VEEGEGEEKGVTILTLSAGRITDEVLLTCCRPGDDSRINKHVSLSTRTLSEVHLLWFNITYLAKGKDTVFGSKTAKIHHSRCQLSVNCALNHRLRFTNIRWGRVGSRTRLVTPRPDSIHSVACCGYNGIASLLLGSPLALP
jgi:hypothetical protein